MPNVRRAKARREVAVCPRLIELVMDVSLARVVADPFAVVFNVRSIGMSGLIAKIARFRAIMRRSLEWFGAASGSRMSGRGVRCPSAMSTAILGLGWKTEKKCCEQDAEIRIHVRTSEVEPTTFGR